MRLSNLHPAAGSTQPRKRRGKGSASGLGGTAGKGHKGHKARTGGRIAPWFEGGQMPLQRRVPKRGFHNPNRAEYQVVPLSRLASAPAGTTVDRAWLKAAGLARRRGPIKVLGGGEIKVALTIKVDAASRSARQAIEAAGGSVETSKPAAAEKA